GGADALRYSPTSRHGSTPSARISRVNVSNLLREESHFDKVADPLAGAYALDAMVDDLTVAAWNLLLNHVSS
ncbi:MAG: methylmalonyl-CoA mutase, partial [Bacteroidia bacterium]|nr:methylmalonyl-CoA mutase [Bacteroidia bacterium]